LFREVSEYLGGSAMTTSDCPACSDGDLITISMVADDKDLAFTTCHLCDSKWWYQNGELVPLASIVDLVKR
jgi:formate dehydrogenase maturation protein FdhE